MVIPNCPTRVDPTIRRASTTQAKLERYWVRGWVICCYSSAISFPKPAIPWEGNGGCGIIRDRHTKNCMSPVLRMRLNKPQ